MLSHESIRLHISDTRQLVLAELALGKVSLFYVKLCWESFETHAIWITDPGAEAGIQHKHFLAAHQWCKVCFQGKIKHMSHIQNQLDQWGRKEDATGHKVRSHQNCPSVRHRVPPCSGSQALWCAVSVLLHGHPKHISQSVPPIPSGFGGSRCESQNLPTPILICDVLITSPVSVSL